MFSRFSYTLSLMSSSWQVLKKDKELLVFPLLSGICCALVTASFVLPMLGTGAWEPPAEGAATVEYVAYYGVLFLFYFCNYFVITFFNSAIIACAVARLHGMNPNVGTGLRAAFSRIHLIVGWALFSATVGLVLRIIEDRSKAVGRIVAGLLGAAWSIVTFLAVPVLVVENAGPIEAFKRSARMLKDTWGEQLIGNFGFGLVFFVLAIPAFIIGGVGVAMGTSASLAAGIALAVVYLIILGLVQAALQAIFQAALYLYARGDGEPEGFQGGVLAAAARQRSEG
jgi:hypothetical protein